MAHNLTSAYWNALYFIIGLNIYSNPAVICEYTLISKISINLRLCHLFQGHGNLIITRLNKLCIDPESDLLIILTKIPLK